MARSFPLPAATSRQETGRLRRGLLGRRQARLPCHWTYPRPMVYFHFAAHALLAHNVVIGDYEACAAPGSYNSQRGCGCTPVHAAWGGAWGGVGCCMRAAGPIWHVAVLACALPRAACEPPGGRSSRRVAIAGRAFHHADHPLRRAVLESALDPIGQLNAADAQ